MEGKKRIKISLGTAICLFIILVLIICLIVVKLQYNNLLKANETEKSYKHTPITIETFKNYIDTHGFNVVDAKKRFTDSTSTFMEGLKNGYLTEKNDKEGFRVNFFEFNDESHTMLAYYDEIIITEKNNTGEFTEKNEVELNYSKYTATSNGNYIVMIRIDNTLIYTIINKDNKEIVDNLLTELGY